MSEQAAGPGAGWVDGHVHTQFSWDAVRGDMEATCRRAVEIGLPALAFTEHADYVHGVHEDMRPLDTHAYLEELERCRSRFPDLRVLAGLELGEPHLHAEDASRAIGEVGPDRILGSVHVVEFEGHLTDASARGNWTHDPVAFVQAHLAETLCLVQSDAPFEVLAHLDYPKRYWPHDAVPFDVHTFEEELRAILRGLSQRDGVLELNTTRGAPHARGLCPGPQVLGWWHELGGRAIAFGSDAHQPDRVFAGFREAGVIAEAAGFRPSDDPSGFWRR